jgi:hypothetical protein
MKKTILISVFNEISLKIKGGKHCVKMGSEVKIGKGGGGALSG